MDRLTTRRDIVSGSALVLFSVVYYLGARGLPAGTNEPGPGFFPKILAGALAAVGIVILARARGNRSGSSGAPRSTFSRPLLLAAATLAYIPAFTVLGFVPATLALSTVAAVFFRGDPNEGSSSWKWSWIVVPLITTALLYTLFAIGLGVPLPPGDLWR